MRTRMKRFDAAASLFLALGLVALGGCGDVPWQLDPFAVNGRDRQPARPLGYATLMRIGDAARAGGDLATAVSVYRRAAAIDTRAVAPFVAAGNALLEMGQFNEAIVAYNAALARDARDPRRVARSRPRLPDERQARACRPAARRSPIRTPRTIPSCCS